MINNPIGVMVGILLLMVTGNSFAADIDCLPLDPREQVSKETENDIRGAVETLFKIGKIEAEYARRVKEKATLIYKDHPNYDQLVLKSKLIYLFCETLKKGGLSGEEQQKRLLDFMNALSLGSGLPDPQPERFAPDPLQGSQRGSADILGKWVYTEGGLYTETSEKHVNAGVDRYYWIIRPGADGTYRIDLYSVFPHQVIGEGTAQLRDDVLYFTLNWDDHEIKIGSETRFLRSRESAGVLNGELTFNDNRLVGHTDARLHRIYYRSDAWRLDPSPNVAPITLVRPALSN